MDMSLDEWYRQEWNRRGDLRWSRELDLPRSYRVVATWWDQVGSGRIRLLEPGKHLTWTIEVPYSRNRSNLGLVDCHHENGRLVGTAEISELNVRVTPQLMPDFGDNTFRLRRDGTEVEAEWTWFDPFEALRSLGEAVMQGYSDGISRDLEYMAMSALTGTSCTASTATQGGARWDSRYADPLADLERIANGMYGRGFTHEPDFSDGNKAEAKAHELLVSMLDEVQKDEFKAGKSFHVVGQSGKVYKITHARNYNVKTTDEQGQEVNLCAVLQKPGSNQMFWGDQQLPICDQMLAQMLMLQTDEERFLTIANRKWSGPVFPNANWGWEMISNEYTSSSWSASSSPSVSSGRSR